MPSHCPKILTSQAEQSNRELDGSDPKYSFLVPLSAGHNAEPAHKL